MITVTWEIIQLGQTEFYLAEVVLIKVTEQGPHRERISVPGVFQGQYVAAETAANAANAVKLAYSFAGTPYRSGN